MPTLDWLNRAAAFTTSAQVPYRLLEPVSTHGDAQSAAGNLLIQGDNLEALKALLPFYRGQVKCIFIDPPYNTKSAFEHYDDNLEHSQWLSMMLPRLQLLRELLSEDGSIWVTIDDNEGHYLKVLMDEVFGRGNFVASVIWRKNYSPKSTARHFSEDHDYVLIYAKNGATWLPNLMPRTEKQDRAYKNPDKDPRGAWKPGDLSARNFYGAGTYPITTPSGRLIAGPPNAMYWRVSEQKLRELDADQRIWWGKDGANVPAMKRFLSEVKQGLVPQTWWSYEEVGHTQDAKREVVELFGSDAFGTPKPERLLAVAHKMGRRWIGIEMGEHAATHCLPRLQKVIDGEQGGISQAVGWGTGANGQPFDGGGFRFARLGAPIFDANGCIHPNVRFATLAAFIWQQETATAFDAAQGQSGTPYLGTNSVFDSCLRLSDGRERPISSEILDAPETPPTPVLQSRTAYYLLFNGILGDKRPASGNVLTSAVLDALLALHASTAHPEAPLVVYGEACRLGEARLAQARVTFKHIPYDVKAR